MGQTGIVEIWENLCFLFLCVLGCLQQKKAVLIHEFDSLIEKRGASKRCQTVTPRAVNHHQPQQFTLAVDSMPLIWV